MRTLRPVFGLMMAILLVVPLAFAGNEPPPDTPVFTGAELDQMLAPIALYPDSLLSQILMAATYPLEVVEAARWSKANPQLHGQDAVRAVDDRSWDASVKSLVAFPDVLAQMDANLEWTERLGDAFLVQQAEVMDTVQSLRQKAEDAGNLDTGEHYRVVHEGPTIVVESPYPDVVYVPYYDPFVVYGSWWWPHYYPVRWDPWYGYTPAYLGFTGIYWGGGITIGTGFFYSHCDWHNHYVRVVDDTPWYYRERRPAHGVWEHEPQHRLGVPYRHASVYNNYSRTEPRARYRERDVNEDRSFQAHQQAVARGTRPDSQQRVEQRGTREIPGDTSRIDRAHVQREQPQDSRDSATVRMAPATVDRHSERPREGSERSAETHRNVPIPSAVTQHSRDARVPSQHSDERRINSVESTVPATGWVGHQQPDAQQHNRAERMESPRAPAPVWSSSHQRDGNEGGGQRASDSGVRWEPQHQNAEAIARPAPVERAREPVVSGGNDDRSSSASSESRPAASEREDRGSGHGGHDRNQER